LDYKGRAVSKVKKEEILWVQSDGSDWQQIVKN